VKYALSEIRKTIICLVGFALAVLASFLTIASDHIPNEWLPWAQALVAAATTYGLFKVPNRPGAGRPARPDVSEVEADPTVTALSHLDADDEYPPENYRG
jgi:hypothetical protein